MLNADVLNFYLTLDNFLAQRPLPELHMLSGDNFLMFQQDSTSAFSLSWSETDARNTASSRCLCPFMGHISSMNSGNFGPICHNN